MFPHFLMAAVQTSLHKLESISAPLFRRRERKARREARFVRLETRRLQSRFGQVHSVCVAALFSSDAIAAERSALHDALVATGITVEEMFEDGTTYPEGHVYVVLTACPDAEAAAGAIKRLRLAKVFSKRLTKFPYHRDQLFAMCWDGGVCGL